MFYGRGNEMGDGRKEKEKLGVEEKKWKQKKVLLVNLFYRKGLW
jgi:hypothetical protein